MKFEDDTYEEIADEERIPANMIAIGLTVFVCCVAGIIALVGWLLKG